MSYDRKLLLIWNKSISSLLENWMNLGGQVSSQALCQAIEEMGGPCHELIIHHQYCRLHQKLYLVHKYEIFGVLQTDMCVEKVLSTPSPIFVVENRMGNLLREKNMGEQLPTL